MASTQPPYTVPAMLNGIPAITPAISPRKNACPNESLFNSF